MVLIHQGYVTRLWLDMSSEDSMRRENARPSSLSWSVKEC